MNAKSFQLLDRLAAHARNTPRQLAFSEVAGGRAIDYATLAERVAALSGEIRGRVAPSAVITLRVANRIEFPIWFLAILASGANVFPLAVDLSEAEVQRAIDRSGAVASESVLAAEQSAAERSIDAGDLLLNSSGTTGVAKIVRRSAASLDAVAENTARAIDFSPADVVLAIVPLTHSYGVEHGLLAPLWAGSTVRLCDGFDVASVSRELASGATIVPAVPSMIEILAAQSASLRVSNLRAIYTAGGPLPGAVAERFLVGCGISIGQVYGMTEIGSVTYNDPRDVDFDPASVGRPMNGVSVRILNLENDSPLPRGEIGQIAVRAPSMLREYLAEKSPLVDGHFLTGDLGRIDARDRLIITGRVRLLIDLGGKKINPLEVESVLGLHPDVRDCVVVGMRQSETIERVRAFIVPRDHEAPPTSESIRQFARERLAAFKVPRVVEFRAALPRSATGKLQRHLLETS